MTVIAFQGDREYWESTHRDSLKALTKKSNQANEVTSEQVSRLLEQIATVRKQEGIENVKNPDPKMMDVVATELEHNYRKIRATDEPTQTNQEKLAAFADYCLTLVQSNTLTNEKKNTILFLLKTRLEGAVN